MSSSTFFTVTVGNPSCIRWDDGVMACTLVGGPHLQFDFPDRNLATVFSMDRTGDSTRRLVLKVAEHSINEQICFIVSAHSLVLDPPTIRTKENCFNISGKRLRTAFIRGKMVWVKRRENCERKKNCAAKFEPATVVPIPVNNESHKSS